MVYLVFDIGGTALKYGLLSKEGTIIEKYSEVIPESYELLLVRMDQLCKAYQNLSGVAISSPGIFDYESGLLTTSSALEYLIGKPFLRDLSLRIQLPMSIENDGKCALLGEYWRGSAQGASIAAMFVIGTAVGGAILINGDIHRGAHKNGGELGYMLVQNTPEEQHYASLGGKIGFHGLLQYLNQKGYSIRNGLELFERAQEDQTVEKLYKEQLSYLVVTALNLQYSLDPEIIVVGGAVSQNPYFKRMLDETIEQVMARRANYMFPRLVIGKFGNDANLLGALYHFLKGGSLET
ncbi:ROK family protein [Lactococcus ileimucosae]|uniref:ROK family protein n=1 Tax=Lactococcus ileimucosae TaxID=2941329 RepID=A0ABV4D4K3_9LACT